jgi:hypothetical protein
MAGKKICGFAINIRVIAWVCLALIGAVSITVGGAFIERCGEWPRTIAGVFIAACQQYTGEILQTEHLGIFGIVLGIVDIVSSIFYLLAPCCK